MEGAIVGATDQGKAEAKKELLCEHVHLENEAWVQVAKLAPMHMVDGEKPRRWTLCWLPAENGCKLTKIPCLREEMHF